MFITEVEYIALGHVSRKVVWIQKFINKMQLETMEGLTLFGDNEMSIALAKNIKS